MYAVIVLSAEPKRNGKRSRKRMNLPLPNSDSD